MNDTLQIERYPGGSPKRKKFRIEGKLVWRSRFVMEQVLGRKLRSDEIVHHINGNPMDDRPENLQVTLQGKHARGHLKGIKRSLETRLKKMGDKNPNWKGGISLDKAKWGRERYRRLKEQGLCPKCGEPLDRKGTYCNRCIQKGRTKKAEGS